MKKDLKVIRTLLVIMPLLMFCIGFVIRTRDILEVYMLIMLGCVLWLALWVVIDTFYDNAHNGLPRPEDELPRKKLFGVFKRGANWLILWERPSRDKPSFWEFEEGVLPSNVIEGTVIVCLDDIETEYTAAWKDQGVIPILSASARKKAETKRQVDVIRVEDTSPIP